MNIHLMCPVGYTGYGYASVNLLSELSQNNNVALTTIGNPNIESNDQGKIISKAMNLGHMIPYDAPALKIWHQFDLLNRPGNGKYFAFPFFEVDTFNQKEIYHLNFPDELIVASNWAKQIIEKNNIQKKVHVVPMGVDTSIFDSSLKNQTDNYVFVTIGKWEKRKAHDTIIDCFNAAFSESDNVELWMVTHNPFLSKEEENKWIGLVERCKLKKKIKIFPRLSSHKDLANLISYTNCGIYISRGEGWNMELLETMAMNKPVIASNYSAHTEYCRADNCFLVDMPETELAMDNKWFMGTSNWGKIDSNQISQTIEYMRHCYKNNVNTNENGLKTAKTLSWKNSVDLLLGCIT